MNGKALVLDTNIMVDYLKGSTPHTTFMEEQGVGCQLWISVITEMEILSYHALTKSQRDEIRRYISNIAIMPLSNQVKEIAIAFRHATRCKMPDAIIAATAIRLGAVLVTNDKKLQKSKFPGFEAMGI